VIDERDAAARADHPVERHHVIVAALDPGLEGLGLAPEIVR
jgi:hypothetical protein